MEDVYTIKVKSKPDTRNVFPSERRYSASTVAGLGWVHAALAVTAALLAALALLAPAHRSADVLVACPALLAASALAAGGASALASVRWYEDRNIAWLLAASGLSALVSLVAFVATAAWFVATSSDDIADFYKDKVPFEDYVPVKRTRALDGNGSHTVVALGGEEEPSRGFTERVLTINILIASFLELLWSLLSVKISYRGMRSDYGEGGEGRRAPSVTEIKGGPRPDLIRHHPASRGYGAVRTASDSTSEIYKERMLSFLERCGSEPAGEHPDLQPIPEITVTAPASASHWGDTPDHTVYNQNTLDLDNIFNFNKSPADTAVTAATAATAATNTPTATVTHAHDT